MTVEDISLASHHIQRWEQWRVAPAVLVLGAVALFSSSLAVAVPCVLALAVLAGLYAKWRRDAKRITERAVRLTDPYVVRFTDSAATFSQDGTETVFGWDEVAYVTRTASAWVVVPKDARMAFMLRLDRLSPSQTAEFDELVAGWPQRKYRRMRVPF
jgi:hypothetical protein